MFFRRNFNLILINYFVDHLSFFYAKKKIWLSYANWVSYVIKSKSIMNDVMHIFDETVLYFLHFRAHTFSIEYHRYLGLQQVLKYDCIFYCIRNCGNNIIKANILYKHWSVFISRIFRASSLPFPSK